MTPFVELVISLMAVALASWLINTRIRLRENLRGVFNIVLALIVVGIGLWLINNFIPMAGSILAILNIVVVAATIVGVLKAFGLWDSAVRMWDNLIHRAHTDETHHQSPLITR
jgi:hypothetical protein